MRFRRKNDEFTGLRTYRQFPCILYLLFDFGSLELDKFDHNFDNISDFYHHNRDHQNIPLCKYSTSNQGTCYHLLHTCYLFHTQKVPLDFESKQLKMRNNLKIFLQNGPNVPVKSAVSFIMTKLRSNFRL